MAILSILNMDLHRKLLLIDFMRNSVQNDSVVENMGTKKLSMTIIVGIIILLKKNY